MATQSTINRWKETGRCLQCGCVNDRLPKTKCSECAQKEADKQRARFAARQAAGQCIRCPRANDRPGKQHCSVCLDDEKKRIRVRPPREYCSYLRLRQEIIDAYGGKCANPECGIADTDVLCVDHIHDDGFKERKSGSYGSKFYYRLRAEGFPKDRYQLLCANCNMIKRRTHVDKQRILKTTERLAARKAGKGRQS